MMQKCFLPGFTSAGWRWRAGSRWWALTYGVDICTAAIILCEVSSQPLINIGTPQHQQEAAPEANSNFILLLFLLKKVFSGEKNPKTITYKAQYESVIAGMACHITWHMLVQDGRCTLQLLASVISCSLDTFVCCCCCCCCCCIFNCCCCCCCNAVHIQLLSR